MAARVTWVMSRFVLLLYALHFCSCYAEFHKADGVPSELNLFHHSCALKKDEGPCKAMMDRFYFDIDTHQCVRFDYGGCQGNPNNFETLEKCEEMCVVKADKSPCYLEEAPGPCRGLVLRYFFNARNMRCESFFYGGCFGNANNFRTMEQCRAKCHPQTEADKKEVESEISTKPDKPGTQPDKPGTQPEKPGTQPSKPSTQPLIEAGEPAENGSHTQPMHHRLTANVPDYCLSFRDRGTCGDSAKIKRFFYNAKEKKCQAFRYSGCGGNKNNFSSRRNCLANCMKAEFGLLKEKQIRIKTRTSKILFRAV